MLRKLTVICAVMVFATLMFASVQAADHAFVGVKKCKMCHKKDGVFKSWSATPHATAFDKLPDDKKADPVCLGCHSTGVTAKKVLLEGVQCEACHGAGADYKKKKIMQDKEAAMKAGLIMPDEKTCVKCHSNPKALPKDHAEMPKFDYAKAKEVGLHAPAKKAKGK